MIDYYAILGVSRTASLSEIRDAYLRLARDSHPDKIMGGDARKAAEHVFMNITAAYDTLSKDRSRREHTAKLHETNEGTGPMSRGFSPPIVQGPPLTPNSQAATGTIASGGGSNFDALGQGIEAFKKQDYHTAVQYLNLAVRKDDKNAKAHAMLGLALGKNRNWIRDALGHMEIASKLAPKNVTYLVELALLLQSQGLKLRAKRALENAIALDPDHADVARGRSEIPIEHAEPDPASRSTAEAPRGLFDRLLKR